MGFNIGRAIGGAITGATVGYIAGGPPGAAIGAGVGGVTSGTSGSGGIKEGAFDPFGSAEKRKQEEQALTNQFGEWRQYAAANAPQYTSVLNQDLTGWGASSSPAAYSSVGVGNVYKPTLALEDLTNKFTIQNTYDPQYFQRASDYAYSTADSPWLSLMKSRLQEQKLQNISDVAQQTAAAQTSAREQLASKRGLSSGAAERIATQGSLAQMFGRQQAAQDIGSKIQEAAIEEARSKTEVMTQLPGMELQRTGQAADIQKANIANLLDERARQQNYELQKYQTEMAAWAAEQQARAGLVASRPTGINAFLGNLLPQV